MDIVREETDAAFFGSENDPDMHVLLNNCPHLDAMWFETMRLYNATSAVREATSPCIVGGKTIRVGDQIVAPFRQFHTNPDIFGGDALNFRPERFLEDRGLSRKKGYAPFGGGYTYCPGRLFAQREIYLFVALTLRTINMRLVPRQGGARVPQADMKTPSPAAIGPDEDVIVRLQPRELKS